MADAKFGTGELVTFTPGLGDANIPTGIFTVLWVMPSEGGHRSYRVRGARDGQERVLPEDQLMPASDTRPRAKR
jgi:hypothetical protein